MKKFIYTFLLVLILIFAIDRLGGRLMWTVNQQTKDVSGPKIKYLVNDADEDLILLGASRCNLHYVPQILKDSLGLTVYNGGIDASDNIFAHYIILNHLLQHHKPKIIGLEVMVRDYNKQEDPFRTITFFAPYIGKNRSADSVFMEAGTLWKYKLSHLYRYNSKAVSNLAGLIVDRQAGNDAGYMANPKSGQIVGALVRDNFRISVDSLKIKYIQKFINLCKEKGIYLYFSISPKYQIVSEERYALIKKIAEKNGIPVFDYHSTGMFFDKPEYFRDRSHLCDSGARAYSSIFAGDLKAHLDSVFYDDSR